MFCWWLELQDNEELGLVQARWSFVNKDENLLTRLQNINLAFHFEVEQQVNGVFLNFFGFNGTAGVWRIKALEEAGGWLERTTVEDMDIAVRAHLHGWKFIFLNDVEVSYLVGNISWTFVCDLMLICYCFVQCQCELPESYEAYRKQQHRWHSGPMQLFRLCLPDIVRSKVCDSIRSIRLCHAPCFNHLTLCSVSPNTDWHMEEIQLDLPVLSATKADITVLFIYTFLHYSSDDDVRSRSRVTCVGRMLHSSHHVFSQHSSSTKVLPFHCPLPPFREHNVGNKVQRNGFGTFSTRQCIRMGRYEEIRSILRGWSRLDGREKRVEHWKECISYQPWGDWVNTKTGQEFVEEEA